MNPLKEKWSKGLPTLNGWCSIGNTFTAEIMSMQDFDSVTVDIQHGALDYSDALPMLQAMKGGGKVLLARVPWREPGAIMKALDAGAMGIICPMINNASEAAEFVSYVRYPPLGQRSFGPTRAAFAYPGYNVKAANEDILAFAMVETASGMKNLDEIASTPGLDGIYVGPADLSLGVTEGRLPPGFDREEDEMIAHLKTIVAACKANGIASALHCATPEYAATAIGWGFNMTTVSGDARYLAAAAGLSVSRWRDLTKTADAAGDAGAY